MSQVKLSLQNALLTLEQLQQTPSREDGITEEQEDHLRQLGCHLIQHAGILLKLPQVAMATGQILFQRFFYQASLRKFAVRDISMGSVFLAAKVEECPIRFLDLVNVFDHLIKKFHRLPLDPMPAYQQTFYTLKDATVVAEMQILKKLSFNVHVQTPYAIMINYLKVLELIDHPIIPQLAWSYLNDGLRTKDIENIAGHITLLYHRPLPISTLPLTIEQVEPYIRGEFNKNVNNGSAASEGSTTTAPPPPTKSTRVSRFS
ncbi:hypothetical protein BGZ97_010240 [Linnemannia gamsii]|uniref:Cyclin N-terminal domain-containing protein n=1 Tax=Linnemannia gamsii TaxID=64522 RepID=A0A9P6RME4_9FUNG|nr:hypothetical protein BGZ97_010240 [Linnemannia gamsii]